MTSQFTLPIISMCKCKAISLSKSTPIWDRVNTLADLSRLGSWLLIMIIHTDGMTPPQDTQSVILVVDIVIVIAEHTGAIMGERDMIVTIRAVTLRIARLK